MQSPMTADAMNAPALTEQALSEANAWCANIGGAIQHDPHSLPFKDTTYHTACVPGMCCMQGRRLQRNRCACCKLWHVFPKAAPGTFSMMMGTGEAGLMPSFFMVAHRRDRPRASVMLAMALTEEVAPCDLHHGRNLSWRMKFQRCADSGPSAGHLDLHTDAKFMLAFHRKCLAYVWHSRC